jgi:hypothetical protein
LRPGLGESPADEHYAGSFHCFAIIRGVLMDPDEALIAEVAKENEELKKLWNEHRSKAEDGELIGVPT